MTSEIVNARPARRTLVAAGLAAAIIIAVGFNAADAAIAHAAGASGDFSPLKLPTYAALTVVGILGGAAGWTFIRARAARPRRLLRRLVPGVLALSFIPDILVGASGSLAGTSWGAVAALMVMHLIVGSVAVIAYLRFLPLPADQV